MKKILGFLGGMALLFAAPWAGAQNVTLTSAGNNIYDNIYVSPYYATVNGAPNTPIVCDDFADDSYLNTSWTANVVAFSSLGSASGLAATAWGAKGGTLQLYEEAAWLTESLLQQTPGTLGQIEYSYGVWAVFDPTGVASYLDNGNAPSAANVALCNFIFGSGGCASSTVTGGLLGTAGGNSYSLSQFSNVFVITPTLSSGNTCAAGGCPEQEFIQVAPEGGAALGYLALAGACCFGAMFWRSRQRIAIAGAA